MRQKNYGGLGTLGLFLFSCDIITSVEIFPAFIIFTIYPKRDNKIQIGFTSQFKFKLTKGIIFTPLYQYINAHNIYLAHAHVPTNSFPFTLCDDEGERQKLLLSTREVTQVENGEFCISIQQRISSSRCNMTCIPFWKTDSFYSLLFSNNSKRFSL